MIIVRCQATECKNKDTLVLTEKFGGIPVMFYCTNHNQCLNIEDIIYVERKE